MRKYILALALLTIGAIASDVVKFDPVSSPVTNRVEAYLLSVNTPEYVNKTNYLVITNRAVQIGAGVNATNYSTLCVVDGQAVRLMTQAELDRIAATNAINASNALWQTKYEARAFATNVFNGNQIDGRELFIRSLGQATWFFVNFTRTNDGKAALPTATFTDKVKEFINTFGQ